MKKIIKTFSVGILIFALGLFASCQKDGDQSASAAVEKAAAKKVEPPAPKPEKPAASDVFAKITPAKVLGAEIGNKPGQLLVKPAGGEMQELIPQAMAMADDGSILIIDGGNDRVLKYDAKGAFKSVVVKSGAKHWRDLICAGDGGFAAFDANKGAIVTVSNKGKVKKTLVLPPKLRKFSGFHKCKKGLAFMVLGRNYRIENVKKLKSGAIGKKHIKSMPNRPAPEEGKYISTKKVIEEGKSLGLVQVFTDAVSKKPALEYKIKSPVEGASLGAVTYIGGDKKGNAYFKVEMLEKGKTIKVTRFVAKYTSDGKEVCKIKIPGDCVGAPARDMIISPDGMIYALLPYADRVEVLKWQPSN